MTTLKKKSELTFLWNNFNAYFNQQENVPWISLTDQETEGTWKYASGPENGQTASWALWANGEGGSSPGEDYAVLHWQRGNGNFFDYTSEYNQPYIVEWDTAPLEISSYVTASDSNKTYKMENMVIITRNLNGDFKRKQYGQISDLIPYVNTIQKQNKYMENTYQFKEYLKLIKLLLRECMDVKVNEIMNGVKNSDIFYKVCKYLDRY